MDNIIRNIEDLKEYIKSPYNKMFGDLFSLPLQSDYTIVIYANQISYDKGKTESLVNPSAYEPVLVQSLTLPIANGFTMSMDKLGLQTADFKADNKMTFDFVGLPYKKEDYFEKATYTSIIHYYYAQRFTQNGLLKVKTKKNILPTIFVINLRTNNIVYVLNNCVFSYPTFQPNPSSNAIALYKTEVTFSSYREFLSDDIGKHNWSENELRNLGNNKY